MSNVLPQGWEEKKLDLLAFFNKETLKNNSQLNLIEYLDTSSVTNNIFEEPVLYKISEAPSRAKRIVEEDDIVISTVRPNLEHFGYLKNVKKNLIVSTGFVTITTIKKLLNSKFCYYFLSQNKITNYLMAVAQTSTSTYPSFKPEILKKHLIQYPSDINEQKKIADILSAFDDKIELNNQMNQTLEDMATTLFKEWFENFNFPNEQGNPYKDNDGEMKSSELGEIPIDWDVKYLKEISEIIMGQSPKGRSYNEENIGFPLINGASDFEGTLPKAKKYTTEPTKISNDNDIVFGIRATIGNVVFLNKGYCLGRGVAAVRVTTQLLEFMFLLLKKEVDNLAQIATGSVFANLTKSDLEKLKLVFPNKIILVEFSKIIKPIFEQIQQNQQQNQTLKQQRDTLLPKLMSGEIRV